MSHKDRAGQKLKRDPQPKRKQLRGRGGGGGRAGGLGGQSGEPVPTPAGLLPIPGSLGTPMVGRVGGHSGERGPCLEGLLWCAPPSPHTGLPGVQVWGAQCHTHLPVRYVFTALAG